MININYDEILGPWEIRGDRDIGIIGASIPKNFIVNTSAVTRIQIFGLSLLAVIIVIGIGFLLANQITKPLIYRFLPPMKSPMGTWIFKLRPLQMTKLPS